MNLSHLTDIKDLSIDEIIIKKKKKSFHLKWHFRIFAIVWIKSKHRLSPQITDNEFCKEKGISHLMPNAKCPFEAFLMLINFVLLFVLFCFVYFLLVFFSSFGFYCHSIFHLFYVYFCVQS